MDTKGTLYRASIFLFAGALATGCASAGPEGPEYSIVQTVEVGDDMLSCQDLQSRISEAETIIASLTTEIDGSKTTARANDNASRMGSYLGQSTLFNDILASSARDDVEDKTEVRDSYQRRRDILLTQFMHKRCSIEAISAAGG